MKKIILLFLCFYLTIYLYGLDLINEDFNGEFPPSGWSINSHSSNWSANNSENAGSSAPELRFNWSPQFNGTSRLISDNITLTDISNVTLEFKHSVDNYGGAYTLGIATRSNEGIWHDVWTAGGADVPATQVIVDINNEDVNNDNFQICIYFSGSSYNIDFWYLDDFHLYEPNEHDLAVMEISMDTQYAPDEYVIPSAIIRNVGLNSESFDATCETYINGELFSMDSVSGINLDPGSEESINFLGFITSASNELYNVIITTQLTEDMD